MYCKEISEEAYTTREVYDNCDIPLDVVSDHLQSGGSSVASNFTVSDDGGIARSGNAEASDAEDDEGPVDAAPPALGRGQRKKIAARHENKEEYMHQLPVWCGVVCPCNVRTGDEDERTTPRFPAQIPAVRGEMDILSVLGVACGAAWVRRRVSTGVAHLRTA
ncbi:hypothetical protein C8R45DRAFT_1109289 [Mycena sanguinolenta]|nr:hypothetical protein C8R45DRAFT_1109289 [Mycena sanguinolenta]